jgi:hypothetical protein
VFPLDVVGNSDRHSLHHADTVTLAVNTWARHFFTYRITDALGK